MARIPYFNIDQASPLIREMLSSRQMLNVHRIVAHGGATAEGFMTLGNAILRRSDLPAVLRELVILRVGALCGSEYEVFQHRRVATQAGVPPEQIEAVLSISKGNPSPSIFSPLEQDVLRYTDSVVRDVKASLPLFEAVASRLPPQQLVELTMTIGFYMLVCRVLENFEVDIEDPAPQ
ncbi:carboxymuconolactone decarboxylase family protein [Alloalcanivorax xenomutans]|uniref:carboxymuconolactone decarboxylase family protein n=1 Tax=Alloalcanivorax xenomutans TaxID=1094342 RepID=UPI003BACC577